PSDETSTPGDQCAGHELKRPRIRITSGIAAFTFSCSRRNHHPGAAALDMHANATNILHYADLCDLQFHPGRAEFLEQQIDDEFTQAFDQVEMAFAQFTANARGDHGVINGVCDIVVLGGSVGHTEGQIELERLRTGLFALVNADPGLDAHFLDED